jgi:hypothetical protein
MLVEGKPMTTVTGDVFKPDGLMKDIRVKCTFTSQTTLECEWHGDVVRKATR